MTIKYALVCLFLALNACGEKAVVITGPPGADGVPGINGVDGQNGTNGTDGVPGLDGQDGISPPTPYMVHLCPGVTAYPSVFVEVALCLNNKLYGVYSANGGFLTYLPPGTYSSNAIGSACNLTVGADCQVTN